MHKTVSRNKALEASLNEILKVQKSKGKHYSKAHRELVLKAFSDGMSLGDVHKLTMIPILTLRSWKKKSVGKNFIEFSAMAEAKPLARSSAAIIINDDRLLGFWTIGNDWLSQSGIKLSHCRRA